ncbi:unnamed protein product, partial [Polarella glacialis]
SQLMSNGVLGSARSMARSTAGAPPPSPGRPRQAVAHPGHAAHISHTEPPKTLNVLRRQIVPAVRERRTPSRDTSIGTGPNVVGSFLSRLTPTGVEKRLEEGDPSLPPPSPRHGSASAVALARSRSLQSISEPQEPAVGVTPPLSGRGPRPAEPLHSARLRCSQITPIGGGRMLQPHYPRMASARVSTVSRLASGVPLTAGSGGTPGAGVSVLRRAPLSRSSLPLPSARTLVPSESATTLRHSDGGSGGTGGGGGDAPSAWALATSRSTPALDMRLVYQRQLVRDTPTATPRLTTSARGR